MYYFQQIMDVISFFVYINIIYFNILKNFISYIILLLNIKKPYNVNIKNPKLI